MELTKQQLRLVFNDNFVAYFRSHVAHVNIQGRNFHSDHELLAGIYEARQGQIDTIAELLRTMGEFMPMSLGEVVMDASIADDDVMGSADDLLSQIRDTLTQLLDQFIALNETADEDELEEIANYAQEQILALRKDLWMLDSTLV